MQLTSRLPATSTRVEQNSSPDLNEHIRARTDTALQQLEGSEPQQITERLAELDREWDIERVLQLNASALAGIGLLLGTTVDRRFMLLPLAVFSFFAQHALQGWCPPIPVFRRLGVRTAREIERERYALKAMRGDFDGVPPAGRAEPAERVLAALQAVDA
jgi:hypothetical protein